MHIAFLVGYDKHKFSNDLRIKNPEGIALSEIESMELALNNGQAFPVAFREYLFIGGKFDSIGLSSGIHPGYTIKYGAILAKRGFNMDRPFFIFDVFEEAICMFIYLDDGDDPSVWLCSVDEEYDQEDGAYVWENPRGQTFSGIIDDMVYRALNGLSPR